MSCEVSSLYDEGVGLAVFKTVPSSIESLSLNFIFNPSLSTPLILCTIVFHL
jgi:hypothetical protein